MKNRTIAIAIIIGVLGIIILLFGILIIAHTSQCQVHGCNLFYHVNPAAGFVATLCGCGILAESTIVYSMRND